MTHSRVRLGVAVWMFLGCGVAPAQTSSPESRGGDQEQRGASVPGAPQSVGAPARRPSQNLSPPHPAFDPVSARDGFPQVLLIGDSISIDYTEHVRGLLAKFADVHRPPVNCESTLEGLERIERWLGAGKWAVIHFNWGLHDLKYQNDRGEGRLPPEGKQKVPLDQYATNLRKLVARLKSTGARLIFATTTPVPEGTSMRIRGEEIAYNRVAREIMAENGVGVDDLHAFVVPRAAEFQRPRNVHFTPEGSMMLAREVSLSILDALGVSREQWKNR